MVIEALDVLVTDSDINRQALDQPALHSLVAAKVTSIELVRHGCRARRRAAFGPGPGHQRRQGCRIPLKTRYCLRYTRGTARGFSSVTYR